MLKFVIFFPLKYSSKFFIDLFPFQIALRWRIDREVITSKGQFICGNKKCDIRTELKSWEVNFAYMENDEKKNALVKLSKYLLILLNVFVHFVANCSAKFFWKSLQIVQFLVN